MNTELIASIKKYGRKARGRHELIKYLEGGRLKIREVVFAHCYDCMGYFADGAVDCGMRKCPLHPFMAYNEQRAKRKTGRVMTEEHKKKIQLGRGT